MVTSKGGPSKPASTQSARSPFDPAQDRGWPALVASNSRCSSSILSASASLSAPVGALLKGSRRSSG